MKFFARFFYVAISTKSCSLISRLTFRYFMLALLCSQIIINFSEAESAHDIININNVSGLSMIGEYESHPIYGNYNITNSFDISHFNKTIDIFKGSIQGNGNSFYNIKRCLIECLAGDGIIQNIIFKNANITGGIYASVVVMEAKDNARIRFIKIENSFVKSDMAILGSVVQTMRDSSQMDNVVVIGGTIIGGTFMASSLGGAVGDMWEMSAIKNITIEESNIVSYANSSKVGGAVGLIFGENVDVVNVTVIGSNVTSYAAMSSVGGVLGYGAYLGDIVTSSYWLFPNDKHINFCDINAIGVKVLLNNVGGFVGGAIGYAKFLKGEFVTVINAFVKLCGKNSASSHVGGVVGSTTYSIFSDTSCINTIVESELKSNAQIGFVAGVASHVKSRNSFIANSDINALSESSYIGGWAVGVCRRDLANTIFINNTAKVNANANAVVKPCSLNILCYEGGSSYICKLSNESLFVGPKTIDLADGGVNYYQWNAKANITNKCSWNKLPFISGNCVIDKSGLESYQQSDNWHYYNFFPISGIDIDSAEDSGKAGLIIALSISSAIVVFYSGYQWYAGCHAGDAGIELAVRPITRLAWYASFMFHLCCSFYALAHE